MGLLLPKSVIVTGASGFLGRHVSRTLAFHGYHVIGIGRGPWGEPEWRDWGLSKWLAADLSVETLSAFAAEPEFIFHCAGSGSVSFSFQHPGVDLHSTICTLLVALEFIRLRAPRAKLIYPSSAAVYGQVESLPIREDAQIRPASPYGFHKYMAEQLCQSHATHFGLQVAVVRFFSLYGPELRKQLLWDACLKFSRGEAEFQGTGLEVRDWVHVEDAAELMRLAASFASTSCFMVNGSSGEGVAVHQLLAELRSSFPLAPPLHFSQVPKAGDPQAYLGDASHAKACCGWSAHKTLRDGLKEYAAWFRQVGG